MCVAGNGFELPPCRFGTGEKLVDSSGQQILKLQRKQHRTCILTGQIYVAKTKVRPPFLLVGLSFLISNYLTW